MGLGFGGRHDVKDIVAGRLEVIGDERAMALPPQGFGAHDGGALCAGESEQALDAGAEFRGHHEIRIAAKSFIAPDGVWGIRARPAASAEFGKMDIIDARIGKRFGEIFLAEMRQAARAGKTADVSEGLDALGSEHFEELFDAAIRVANGPERDRVHAGISGNGDDCAIRVRPWSLTI